MLILLVWGVFERPFCLAAFLLEKKMQERGIITDTGKSLTKNTKKPVRSKLGKIMHLWNGWFLDLNISDNEGEKRAKYDYIREKNLQISIRSSVDRIWFSKKLGNQLMIWEVFGHSN